MHSVVFPFPSFRMRTAEFIKSLGLSKFDFYLRNGRWKHAREKNQAQNNTESTMPEWDTPMSILRKSASEGAAGNFSQVSTRFIDSRRCTHGRGGAQTAGGAHTGGGAHSQQEAHSQQGRTDSERHASGN